MVEALMDPLIVLPVLARSVLAIAVELKPAFHRDDAPEIACSAGLRGGAGRPRYQKTGGLLSRYVSLRSRPSFRRGVAQ